jgi:dolichyl-phosphate-mannose-protein mannosyltransferase
MGGGGQLAEENQATGGSSLPIPPAQGWREQTVRAADRKAGWASTHPLLTVFALALAVRLVNVALLRGNDSFFAEFDTHGYWALGKALARPGDLWSTLVGITDRMPLYPLLLGAVRATFGDAPRVVALIQAAIDAGTCVLIAALGALVSPRVGLIAGLLAAFSLLQIVLSSQILTETLFLFFFTLMLLASAYFLRRPSYGWAALAGLAGGLAFATRPAVALLLAAAVPTVFIIAMVHRRTFVPALAACLIFAATAAMPVAAVLVRNVMHYDAVSLTSQTGVHLALYVAPLVRQRADGTPYQVTVDRLTASYRQQLAARGLTPLSNPFQLSKVWSELGREELAPLPLSAFVKAWLEGMAINLGTPALTADPRMRALPKPSFLAMPGASLWERVRQYLFDDFGLYQALLLAGFAGMAAVLLLEAIGLVMLARMLPWAAVFAAGVLGYVLLLNGPIATAKYRVPMEPVLIVLAALPLARWTERRA